MDMVDVFNRVASDIADKGPVAAKAAAAAMIDAYEAAGFSEPQINRFGSMPYWREQAAASDGSAEALEPMIKTVIRCAAACGCDPATAISIYAAQWVA